MFEDLVMTAKDRYKTSDVRNTSKPQQPELSTKLVIFQIFICRVCLHLL